MKSLKISALCLLFSCFAACKKHSDASPQSTTPGMSATINGLNWQVSGKGVLQFEYSDPTAAYSHGHLQGYDPTSANLNLEIDFVADSMLNKPGTYNFNNVVSYIPPNGSVAQCTVKDANGFHVLYSTRGSFTVTNVDKDYGVSAVRGTFSLDAQGSGPEANMNLHITNGRFYLPLGKIASTN